MIVPENRALLPKAYDSLPSEEEIIKLLHQKKPITEGYSLRDL